MGVEEEPDALIPDSSVTEGNARRRAVLQQQEDGNGPAAEQLPAAEVDALLLLGLLADSLDELEASAGRDALSLQSAIAEIMALFVTGAGSPDLQKLSGSSFMMALLEDASSYYGAAEEGGLDVLRSAQAALERQQALAYDLADLAAESDNSLARENAMAANILLQTELLLSITSSSAQGDGKGEGATPCPTEATGGSDFEFVVGSSSSVGADGGEGSDLRSNGRSLLVSGGKSSKSSTSSSALLDGEDSHGAAVKATANALRQSSWSVIKQSASKRSISMLPARSSAPSDAMAGMKDGVLLHLQQKVRPLLCPAPAKRGPEAHVQSWLLVCCP